MTLIIWTKPKGPAKKRLKPKKAKNQPLTKPRVSRAFIGVKKVLGGTNAEPADTPNSRAAKLKPLLKKTCGFAKTAITHGRTGADNSAHPKDETNKDYAANH